MEVVAGLPFAEAFGVLAGVFGVVLVESGLDDAVFAGAVAAGAGHGVDDHAGDTNGAVVGEAGGLEVVDARGGLLEGDGEGVVFLLFFPGLQKGLAVGGFSGLGGGGVAGLVGAGLVAEEYEEYAGAEAQEQMDAGHLVNSPFVFDAAWGKFSECVWAEV